MLDEPAPVQIGKLATAVCQVMTEVRSIPETGWNQHNKYKYASDSDVLHALQPAMAKAGLALIPNDVQVATVEHGTSSGGNKRFRTDIVVSYLLIHTSGESLRVKVPGCGLDNEDKGSNKAMTGALKYALGQLFLVPRGEDAERDGKNEDRKEEPRQEQRREEAQGAQGRAWVEADVVRDLHTAGLTLDEANWYSASKTRAGLPLVKLSPEQLLKAMEFLCSPQGVEAVRMGVLEIREELQRCFFAKWTLLYPTPRVKDGATDEQRAAADARADADRKAVMLVWYGVESVKTVPIRPLVKGADSKGGKPSVSWLRDVPVNEFEADVLATLKASREAQS